MGDLRSPTPCAARAIEAPEAGASGDAGRRTATFQTVYGPCRARLLADESLGRALGALDAIYRDTEGLAELASGVRRGEYASGTRARRGIQTQADRSQLKSGGHRMGCQTSRLTR